MTNAFSTRKLQLTVHGLGLRLAPFCTARDSSQFTQCLLAVLVSGTISGWGLLRVRLARRRASAAGALAVAAIMAMLYSGVASAGDRVFLTKAEIELSLLGKTVVSKNLASGKLSHWEFRSDGSVEAVSLSGLGRATGTWSIRDDGQTCVKMLGRTGCRYWFQSLSGILCARHNMTVRSMHAKQRTEPHEAEERGDRRQERGVAQDPEGTARPDRG